MDKLTKRLEIDKILALRQKKKDAKMVMDAFKKLLNGKVPYRGFNLQSVISDRLSGV